MPLPGSSTWEGRVLVPEQLQDSHRWVWCRNGCFLLMLPGPNVRVLETWDLLPASPPVPSCFANHGS